MTNYIFRKILRATIENNDQVRPHFAQLHATQTF